jgi:ribosomal protein L3 glutamine methyltransferase
VPDNTRPALWLEAAQHLRRVGDVYRFAISRCNAAEVSFGHGFADAEAEMRFLLCAALHLPRDTLRPHLNARLTPSEVTGLLDLLWRRVADRVPAAYLVREAWLGDLRFYIDERALIPRSVLAELLPTAIEPWATEDVRQALDLCTGSACLAIALAFAYPDAQIDATDLSATALEVAAINVRQYALRDRVRLHQGDLFAPVAGRRFDLVVANPPYVDAEEMAALPEEFRHEPVAALAGGADGMDLVARIINEARKFLAPTGVLLVEGGHHRDRIEARFPRLPFIWLENSGGDDNVFALRALDLPQPFAKEQRRGRP